MFLQRNKLVTGGMIVVLFLLLAACSSVGGNGSTGTGSTATAATSTPQLVTAKSVGGSPGKGPVVISSPTPVPGGKPGSQQVILADRTLIINSITRQKGVSANSALISLDLTIRNTSAKAIMNQPAFFQLVGPEGDTFGYQYNSSDNFYGNIAAHATSSGTIVFQVPAVAVAGLHLLYRPEVAPETAIILLKMS